ncbi:MAG: hydroxymethylglutaryl-CoA reductase, degradative [Candidatus Kapaibacterium sp.]
MMKPNEIFEGFSKLSKEEKLDFVASVFSNPKKFIDELKSYWHDDTDIQQLFEEFSENTITNYFLPYGIVPNLRIGEKVYSVPMVIEESSVVAAASKAAKFWANRGGFHAEVSSMLKVGQVHFIWHGDKRKIKASVPEIKQRLRKSTRDITSNMEKRGGGITSIDLMDMSQEIEGYYQIRAKFDTRDAMGANFINSCLEEFATSLKNFFAESSLFTGEEKECSIIMAILSNYTPECLVKCHVECDIEDLEGADDQLSAEEFAWKFEKAVQIAHIDVNRATTHNKGIFNGIDSVAIATGNDFRAIEASGHTYAARSGKYRSLTEVSLENGRFRYSLELPLALGTVGGLTSLHPLAKRSMEILGRPDAEELMKIAAVVGLANNFGAIKSLITKGIQTGHMKMHLMNILNYFGATIEEKKKAFEYFKNNKVSFANGSSFIAQLRKNM